MRFIFTVFLLYFVSQTAVSQEWTSRTFSFPYQNDTIRFDTLSVIPGSFSVWLSSGTELNSDQYYLDPAMAKIYISEPTTDTIILFYRVFPLDFSRISRKRIYNEPEPDVHSTYNPFSLQPDNSRQDIFLTEGLNKNGSISRGVMVGNNQDLTVNSNLDLQLSGRVSENVSILAAISDNNIPIQPEGNTQQLQDFDQVYIQLFDHRSKLIAGDFQLTSPPSHFMTFFKRAQGASFTTIAKPFSTDTTRVLGFAASGAVSRGKFSRNIIQGIEGNQGPYRLRGNDNESFIIVLSGTERVFIDGELMVRGQEYDYVIDYNTAELTFTAKRLITKDRRIVVEFQYTDRTYARSLLFASSSYSDSKSALSINFYNEQDSRNQPLQQDLDLKRKQFLSGIGDDIYQALYPSLDTASFRDDITLYRLKDTIVGGVYYDSILVFTAQPDTALYKATFSQTGQGNGNYILEQGSSNLKIYTWVAPVNGIPQGDYEPVILLVTPKKRQMTTLTASHKLNKSLSLGGEFAYSENDLNTFSTEDSGDDKDIAFRVWGGNEKKPAGTSGWTIRNKILYEQVNKNFTAIERFRPVEFERDWNILGHAPKENQRLGQAELTLLRKNRAVTYSASVFHIDTTFTGLKQDLLVAWNTNKFFHDAYGSALIASGFGEESNFYRWRSRSIRKTRFINPGIGIDTEWNTRNGNLSDTLLNSSYMYHELEGFITQNDSAVNRFYLGYKQRSDYGPRSENLYRHSFAESVGANYELLSVEWQTLRLITNYRRLYITDSSLTDQKPENTFLGRVEYTLRILKGTILTDTWYETGSGLEQKRDFTYVEVAAGQGNYAWLGDLNDNGIKDINEFEIARYPDQARYIRVFTPSLEYIRTYTNQFSQSIQLSPERIWSGKGGMRQFISRFASQTAYRVERKTNYEEGADRFNPLPAEVSDTNLVSTASVFRNAVFFNRTSALYGIDHTYQDNRSKSILVNGFESRTNQTQQVRGRLNITRKVLLSLELGQGHKTSSNQFSATRNFNILSQEIYPRASYQPGTSFRTTFSFRYSEKNNNTETGNESLTARNFGVEFRYSMLTKGNLTLEGNYILNEFDGKSGTIVAYEMLEGLQPGKNITWNLIWQRNLSKNMQLNLAYQGRVSEESPAVHTGSVQVRAYF